MPSETNQETPKSALSPDYLLGLARKKGAESRSQLAAVITDLFSGEGDALTERERMLMFNILQQVCHEIESSVRQYLSSRLADREDVPTDLISTLANDEIEVAYPILNGSPLLKNEELIEIIRHRTFEHQLAIATRQGLTEDVSDALVETGRTDVIRTLLENREAQISAKTLAYLVEESSRVDEFQEPILRREELPEPLAKRMFLWVSAALRKHIVDTYSLDGPTVDDLLEQAASVVSGSNGGDKASDLAEELSHTVDINADMLISALDNGQVRLFVSLLAKRAQMREQLVTRMLYETGGEGLAICFKALGFSMQDFLTVFAYSRRASPKTMKDFSRQKKDATEFFEFLDGEAAESVLKSWQRDKDYLAAIRELDSL